MITKNTLFDVYLTTHHCLMFDVIDRVFFVLEKSLPFLCVISHSVTHHYFLEREQKKLKAFATKGKIFLKRKPAGIVDQEIKPRRVAEVS